MKKHYVLSGLLITGIICVLSVGTATSNEVIIDDFESYSTGQTFIINSDWTNANSCFPSVIEEAGNKFIQSSSCYNGQGVTKPFKFDNGLNYGEININFSGEITSGSGNNSSAELIFYSSSISNNSFGIGLVNWPSGGYDHQLRLRLPGKNIAGAKLSPGVWYDFSLNVDWDSPVSTGFGLVCLKYKEKESSDWITDESLCNKELNLADISAIDSLQLRMDGISSRLGRIDNIVIYNEGSTTNINTPPVADAGSDQAVIYVGSTIQLDGTQSYDIEGDTITYNWAVLSKPEGSTAELSDVTSPNPTFLADVHGDYTIELVVSDGTSSSTTDQVIITLGNSSPVANAGLNQSVVQGEQVCFDGSDSTDDNEDILSFSWSLTTPDGSSASLDDPLAEITCLTTDLPGTYKVTLVVNDGWVDSPPSTASAYAASYQGATTMTLQETITTINDIPLGDLKNKNMQNSLTRKVNAVLALIEQGEYADALDKLQNNLLDKNNGCATSGSPDKNDWIQDCAEQDQVYQLIMEAIDYVTPLVEGEELKNEINNYEGQPELFFNSLDTQVIKSNVSLVLDDIPMFNIGGNIIDAMSVIEFMVIGDYGSATSSTASIAMAKMIPFIGQLTTAATTGEFLAEKFNSMLTNQAYGAVVDLLVSQNIEKHSKQIFTEVEMLEFLQSGVKLYGSGGFALYEINNMVDEGYLDITISSAEKTYSLTVKGALAIYASLVPPVKDGLLGMYGSPTYEGVEHNDDLLNDLQRALTPSSEW